MTRSVLMLLALGMVAMSLAGCGTYQLRGKVVEGPNSMVVIVDEDDDRLNGKPVGGATIELMMDPRTLGRKALQPDNSRADGTFAITIDELGAGFLEYEFSVLARHRGNDPAYHTFMLPGRSKRLLIVLARGRDRPIDLDPRARDLKKAAQFGK